VAQPKAITVDENGTNGPQPEGRSATRLSLGCDQDIEAGLVVHNELQISGWAVSPEGISGIVVQIGDRTLNATYGLDTPWVAESRPEIAGADRAGFELRVDTADWQPGELEVRIVAFDQTGARAQLLGTAKVLPYDEPLYSHADIPAAITAGEVVMWLESPPILEGPCEVTESVEIRGWAYAEDGLDAVRVMIDGQGLEAVWPIVRPDLLDAFGPEIAGAAGFVLTLHPSECPPGRHKLAVVAVGRDTRSVGVEGEIVVLPEPPTPVPRPDEPAVVEWMGDRDPPRRLGEADGSPASEIERRLCYRWASALAKGRTVLDAGCGDGRGAALLAAGGAERVVAIDSDEGALAKARAGVDGEAIELHRCDLGLLPFEDDSFDLVTCFDALERGEDPDLILKELCRVLSPEGVLLTPVAALGVPASIRRLHQDAQTWEDRALRSEAEAAATRVQFNLARMHQEAGARSLQELEAEFESARERLGEQEGRLVEQQGRLEEQEERLEEQDQRLWAQYEQLEQRQGRLEEQEGRLVEQQGRLEEQDRRLWVQYEQLEQRDALVDSQAATLGARNAELRVTAERLRRAEAEAATWRTSFSVRVTRPLRAIGRGVRRFRGVFSRQTA
jgi:SAM-dependent methyltransferase